MQRHAPVCSMASSCCAEPNQGSAEEHKEQEPSADAGFSLLKQIGEESHSIIWSTKGNMPGLPSYDILPSNMRVLFSRRQAVCGFIQSNVKTSIPYKCAQQPLRATVFC